MGCKLCRAQEDERLLSRKPYIYDGKDMRFSSKYSLGEILGTGGYSIVRKCLKRSTGTAYAVKIIQRAKQTEEEEVSLRQEVRLLKMLDSPYIVKLHDFYEEEKFFYLVQEYVEGGELYDHIANKQVCDENEMRELFVDLLKAIQHCHDNGIVHRDIKPENLLLTYTNGNAYLKLCDFGFAAVTEGNDLTKDCGTLEYVAPEILHCLPYGKAVDMWSIGVILFLLIGGRHPFYDRIEKVQMLKIKMCDYQFDESFCNVSIEAKDLIKKLLQTDPEKRLTVQMALEHPWIAGRSTEHRRLSLRSAAAKHGDYQWDTKGSNHISPSSVIRSAETSRAPLQRTISKEHILENVSKEELLDS